MEAGWIPPVDAWQAQFDDSSTALVCLYVGVQAVSPIVAKALIDGLVQCINDVKAERSYFVDEQGYYNSVLTLYWPSAAEHDAFWAEGTKASSWWEDAAENAENYGVWRERFSSAPDQFETLFSQKCPRGVGMFANELGNPVQQHGYWGSMRDRISAAANDTLDGLCLIRSGQDWSACDPEELAMYKNTVLPSLIAGMDHLRDNADETGCRSCRFLSETTLEGAALDRSFGLAAFRSLAHLERWAHSHDTHLAIFNSFMDMVGARGGNVALSLWHEVFVLDTSRCHFEYVNCHASTGIRD